MNCPDCAGPVDTALLQDPESRSAAVTIWDCPGCQRTGFVIPAQREPEPAPVPPQVPDDGEWFLPGSTPPVGAGTYPPRR